MRRLLFLFMKRAADAAAALLLSRFTEIFNFRPACEQRIAHLLAEKMLIFVAGDVDVMGEGLQILCQTCILEYVILLIDFSAN